MIQKQQKNNSNQGEEKSSPSAFKLKLKRKCVSCGNFFERNTMIRVMVENKTKEVIINPYNKVFGRSAYICNKNECIKIALKKNRIEKSLKIKNNENLSEKLKIMLN